MIARLISVSVQALARMFHVEKLPRREPSVLNGFKWTDRELAMLRDGLARGDTYRDISGRMTDRSPRACRIMAHRLGITKYVRRRA